MDEPLGIMGLIGVFGIVLCAIWAVGAFIDFAVALYFKLQRERDE